MACATFILSLVLFWVLFCYVHGFSEFVYERTTIAKCRVTCIEKFSSTNNKHNNYGCTTKMNWKCDMCWDFCEMLPIAQKTKTAEEMCTDDICMDGCKQACKYYGAGGKVEKLKRVGLKVSKNKLVFGFGEGSKMGRIFVVFGFRGGHWEEIGQTTETKLFVEDATKYTKLMVIVVGSRTAQASNRRIRRHLTTIVNEKSKSNSENECGSIKSNLLQEQWVYVTFLSLLFTLVITAFVLYSRCKTPKQNTAPFV